MSGSTRLKQGARYGAAALVSAAALIVGSDVAQAAPATDAANAPAAVHNFGGRTVWPDGLRPADRSVHTTLAGSARQARPAAKPRLTTMWVDVAWRNVRSDTDIHSRVQGHLVWGQPVKVLGRVRGSRPYPGQTDGWLRVQWNGHQAYLWGGGIVKSKPRPAVRVVHSRVTTEALVQSSHRGYRSRPSGRRVSEDPNARYHSVRVSVGVPAGLRLIRQCESGGNYRAVNPNGHYGAYQFDYGTWASVGGHGNPAHASPAEQDMRAVRLYQQRGYQPWSCARIVGLR